MSGQSLCQLERELEKETVKCNQLSKIKNHILHYDPVILDQEAENLNHELKELENEIWTTFSPKSIHDIDKEYLDIYIPLKKQYDSCVKKLDDFDSQVRNLQIPNVVEVNEKPLYESWFSYFNIEGFAVSINTSCSNIESIFNKSKQKCVNIEKRIQNEKLKIVDIFLEQM